MVGPPDASIIVCGLCIPSKLMDIICYYSERRSFSLQVLIFYVGSILYEQISQELGTRMFLKIKSVQ
jgi:hypothetical protein